MPAVAGNGVHAATYVAHLTCHHENLYSVGEPITGDEVWCVKCYDYVVVLHVAGKFGVKCDNCNFARNYGGQLSAMTKATSHSIRFLGHRVQVFGPDGFSAVEHLQPQLFDAPPF